MGVSLSAGVHAVTPHRSRSPEISRRGSQGEALSSVPLLYGNLQKYEAKRGREGLNAEERKGLRRVRSASNSASSGGKQRNQLLPIAHLLRESDEHDYITTWNREAQRGEKWSGAVKQTRKVWQSLRPRFPSRLLVRRTLARNRSSVTAPSTRP